MRQLIIDRAVLEMLHQRAVWAAHRAGDIEDLELAHEVDAIAHAFSELLGNPHLRAETVPDACSRFDADDVTRTALITRRGAAAFEPEVLDPPLLAAFTTNEPPPPRVRRLRTMHPRFVAASATDEPTRPRVRRLRTMHGCPRARAGEAGPWQARVSRAPKIAEPGMTARWVRGATVTALIALLTVITFLMLGACRSDVAAVAIHGTMVTVQGFGNLDHLERL